MSRVYIVLMKGGPFNSNEGLLCRIRHVLRAGSYGNRTAAGEHIDAEF